jgi:NDP-sugar pyrophosphorylase family protein
VKEPIHLLIPMSGQGTRYRNDGYKEPKPLIPVNGTPMIERLLSNFPARWPVHFVLAENHRKTALPAVLRRLRPKARVSYVPVHTDGPGRAIEEGLKGIPARAPVFVSYCDYGMVWDARLFESFVRESGCDACIVSYRGFHAHYLSPVTYAYARLEGERVVEVREKGSFTDNRENEHASSGGYYFGSAADLKGALAHQAKKNLRVNGELYTSLTVQALLDSRPDAQVRVFEIPAFFQWGTPSDLRNFEYWEKTYAARKRESAGDRGRVSQVLMPMAGVGSRFEGVTRTPKPFLKLNGVAMFERALASLPAPSRTVLVTLDKFRGYLADRADETVFLPETPPGQALSTRAGLSKLDAGKDVIVSSCDHAVVLGTGWKKFSASPRCDAAIFTVRGFPGVSRRPEAYAYVEAEPGKAAFPLVTRVSVKKPISKDPRKDPLLVGTFWFRTAGVLAEGIDALVKDDVRVNGELYLDSVFNNLISHGLKVRMIPLEGYINWGDPDSLSEALYWQDVWGGRAIETRRRLSGVTL